MKCRKRSITSSLQAGLTALIVSSICFVAGCVFQSQQHPKLLTVKTLSSFPSASAIEFDAGKFYILGDDAPYMLVLDSSYNLVDTVRYSNDTGYRIPKAVKPDIESATIISYNDEKFLYALGSFSTTSRKKLFYFPLDNIHNYLAIDLSSRFPERHPAIAETNFEGLAFVKSNLVIANRANTTHRMNQLIIAGKDFNEYIATTSTPVINILLDSMKAIGISGLCYSEEEDKLFFCASEEDTPAATIDGVIGNSYIGWIGRFSTKMQEKSIRPNSLIDLSTVDNVFNKTKIESVCIEKHTRTEFVLDLVSDDDKGHSMIFRIRLPF